MVDIKNVQTHIAAVRRRTALWLNNDIEYS